MTWVDTLRMWLSGLLGVSFRDRHDRMADEARKHATYELPEPEIPADKYRLFWQVRGPHGRFLIEEVKLAWPIQLQDPYNRRTQERFLREALNAYIRLRDRLTESRRG